MVQIKRHLTANIQYLLSQDDEYLERVFEQPAHESRKELTERSIAGELKIGSEGCIGFDPVTGCPGHKIYTNIKALQPFGKMLVNNDESVALQKHLFSIGYKWILTGEKINYHHDYFIYWYEKKDCQSYITLGSSLKHFNNHLNEKHVFEDYFTHE